MEEEDPRKEYPSLPSNYVSLVQLRERWLKEKEREKKEKEQKRKQIENEEQKRKIQNPKYRKQNEIAHKSTVSFNHRSFVKNRLSNEVNVSRSENSRTEDVVVRYQEQKTDESKKKIKVRVKENLTGGKVHMSGQRVSKEKKSGVVTERSGENNDVRGDFRRRGGNLGQNSEVWEQRNSVDQTVEIGRILDNLSLNVEKTSNLNSRMEINRGNWKYKGDSGRFGHRKMWEQRDGNFVWVKKGETSDTNVSQIGSSGTLMKAGEGEKTVEAKKKSNWRGRVTEAYPSY